MVVDRSFGSVDPRQLRLIPADLVAVLAVTILVNLTVFTPIIRETSVRIPFVLVFVLFVPGYVLVAALYPEQGESPTETTDADSIRVNPLRTGIDGSERVALSVGLSVVLVPMIGFLLTFTPWGIRLIPVAITLTAFSLIVTGVAVVRRWRLPEDERFRVPYREWLAAGRSRVFEPDTRADAALTVLLVASVVLAAGSVGYAVANLPQEDEFSAITVLTEDDGELVADGYPTDIEAGESAELIVAIDNHEYRPAEYTVVVVEQTVETGDEGAVVRDQRELDRFHAQIDHGETELIAHEIEPETTGDVRIAWLLYPDDDPPDDPSTENAAYYAHITVEVGDTTEDE